MKLEYLRSVHGHRVATFATATPISNAVSEAWVVQRFLQPETLREAGVGEFDSWAAQFGETRTDIELSPAGNEYRLKTRFSKYRNVPELLLQLHQVADVKMAEDLALPKPEVHGGKPEVVLVPSSSALEDFIQSLGDRADQMTHGIGPDNDNMLKVCTDGRRGRWTSASSTWPMTRVPRARSRSPPTASRPSGAGTRTRSTRTRPGWAHHHDGGRSRWCSPTWVRRAIGGTRTTRSAPSFVARGMPPEGIRSFTKRGTTGRRVSSSRRAGTARCRC